MDDQVSAAVDAARSIPDSEPERMFDYNLHGTSWGREHQRTELARELDVRNRVTLCRTITGSSTA